MPCAQKICVEKGSFKTFAPGFYVESEKFGGGKKNLLNNVMILKLSSPQAQLYLEKEQAKELLNSHAEHVEPIRDEFALKNHPVKDSLRDILATPCLSAAFYTHIFMCF